MGKFDNVKSGDTVYCIGDDEDYTGFLFMAVCNGYVYIFPEDRVFLSVCEAEERLEQGV